MLKKRLGYAGLNAATLVPNPEPKRREVLTFETVAELEIVAGELRTRFSAIPVFAGLTGLRPEESIGLERRDVDTATGSCTSGACSPDGELKLYGKQTRSLRLSRCPPEPLEALAGRSGRGSTRRCCSPAREAGT